MQEHVRRQSRSLVAGALAILAGLALALSSIGSVAAEATLVPSWEGGALVIRASGFQAVERVDFSIELGGRTRTMAAEAGLEGEFTLFTEMPVTPGQTVVVKAVGQAGTTAELSAVVPNDIGPRVPIRLLPVVDAPGSEIAGPGQAVPRPAAQCSRAVACSYNERNLLPEGLRLQSLEVCGANCTTQYWVSGADGRQLLEVAPTRGGVVLAVRHGSGTTPAGVRVVAPSYAPGDAACCASAYVDTTYLWDEATSRLVPGEPQSIPAPQFPGWEQVRQQLLAEGWQQGGV
jgi:hypothetical protein